MELLAILAECSTRALPNLHILVTSRREPDITEKSSPLATILPISIQGEGVENDIRFHVRMELAMDLSLKKWRPQIKVEIGGALVKGANGMYENLVFATPSTTHETLTGSAGSTANWSP